MLSFILTLFYIAIGVIFLYVLIVGSYVAYLMLSDLINPAYDDQPEASNSPSTSVTDAVLNYLDDCHSPLAPVKYDDRLFSTLGMDGIDIQAFLRTMSERFNVELSSVELFSKCGADPTVYNVLRFIGNKVHNNI